MRADRTLTMAHLSVLAIVSVGCNAVLGPSQPDSNWATFESARFTLHARPGSFAAEQSPYLAQVLENQYDATLRALGAQYAGRVSGFLYASALDAGRESDRSGTAYPATESFAATCTAPLEDGLLGLLAHEANHVIIWNGLGRPGTSFVNEGLASAVISERYHRAGRHFLYNWTRINRGRLPTILSLTDDGEWPTSDAQLAYNTSASFLAYLIDTYGTAPIRELYSASSHDFAERFQQAYGRPVEEIEAAWRRFTAEWTGDGLH